jgi:hypothetical protein
MPNQQRCSCQSVGEWYDDHAENCDLYKSTDFMSDIMKWSDVQHRLVVAKNGEAPSASYDDPFEDDPTTHKIGVMPKTPGVWSNKNTANKFQAPPFKSCTHDQQEFLFSNGLAIYLSKASQQQRNPRIQIPDVHIMLASAQRSIGIAWYVDWTDHGTPNHPDSIMWQFIESVVDLLEGGSFIEAGCIGAHGRTGTFLGLLEWQIQYRQLSEGSELTTPGEMIKLVRENYCEHAIEGKQQEAYLKYYYDYLLGNEPSPPLLPPVPSPDTKFKEIPGQISFEGHTY